MEYNTLILTNSSLSKNICRTCLGDSNTMFVDIQDLVEHDVNQVKLIDILVFLNCLENNDEENWPQSICETCVSIALNAYDFKINCLKANATLSRIFNVPSSSPDLQRSDMDSIDINVVYQDHEYDVPLFSNNPVLYFETNQSDNKELIPLPPVSEITSTEQPKRKVSEKKYSCNICSKSFTRIHGMVTHMEKHTKANHFLCSKCGKSFSTSASLRQHLKTHNNVRHFKCGFCSKNYKSRQSLKEHFRVAHSSNRKKFVCTICDKSFTAKCTLMLHIQSHNGIKQYSCNECPKSYTRKIYLKQHKLSHMGDDQPKPFACEAPNCLRRFTSKYSLLIHMAHTHSTTRQFQCNLCSKKFATQPGLKTHMESHSTIVLKCDICDKDFTNKRQLQKHVKMHDVDPNDMILETVVDNAFLDQVLLELP